ncbi:MAG: LutC/YkgG family protein [Janthinobacterium lividum]
MTRRDDFLAKVRAAQPEAVPRDALPYFPATCAGGRQARFAAALTTMGGLCVTLDAGVTPAAYIAGRFGAGATLASAVDSVPGTRALAPDTPPASLEDVDIGVVRARFGVAETGSVWFSEIEYRVNAIGYLAQHLVVLLDPAMLVDGLQDAYRRDDFARARYAVLVTGPSATADIEGVLIRGAQGVRSLTVLWSV